MASRLKKKSSSSLSDEAKEHLTKVGKLICQKMVECVFTVDGTPTATVKLSNDTFRKQALQPGAEFIVRDAYVGQRGLLIFQFEPVDAQDFLVEADIKQVDTIFENFGIALSEVFGDVDSETAADFVAHISRQMRAEEKRLADEAAAAEAKRQADIYKDNPLFGSF